MGTVVKLETATFEDFWSAYPLKKGKAKARTLFNKITSPGGYHTKAAIKEGGEVVGMIDMHLEASPEEIIEGAKSFAKGLVNRQTFKMDLTYCPHATTWLNNARWEDE